MTIGERIKEIRLYKKFMSRDELAKAVDCSPESVREWECNRCIPHLIVFIKLLKVFHITCEEFMKGVDLE